MSKGGRNSKNSTFAGIMEAAQKDTASHIDGLVKFSFKYLSLDNGKFDYIEYTAPYFLGLLDRLKNISLMKMAELMANRGSTLRFHPIKWSGTSEEAFGIPNEDQLVSQPYQFSLSANEHGRVHGFVIDTQFYVVWLDKHHRLYPGQ